MSVVISGSLHFGYLQALVAMWSPELQLALPASGQCNITSFASREPLSTWKSGERSIIPGKRGACPWLLSSVHPADSVSCTPSPARPSSKIASPAS